MEASNQRRFFWIAAAVWTVASFGLRFLILHNSVVAHGRILAGRSALLWTLILALAGLLLLWGLSGFFRKKPCTDRVFSRGGYWFILPLAGALLLLIGNLPPVLALLRSFGKQSFDGAIRSIGKLQLLSALFGLISALLMAAVLLRRSLLGKNAFWLQLPLILFTGTNMIRHFRAWSHDPIVLDIAPMALSALCFLLAVVMISGFSVSVGRRRSTGIWCAMAVICTAMILPDYLLGAKTDIHALLIWLGQALWCGFHGGMLLTEPDPAGNDAPIPADPAEEEVKADDSPLQ